MLSSLFKTKPVIDKASEAWILDSFTWCLEQLDDSFFAEHSQLVQPTNEFYPGKSSSIEEMATSIFNNTLKYTGMSQWPLKLVKAKKFIQQPMPQLHPDSRMRGENASIKLAAQHNYNHIQYSLAGEMLTPTLKTSIDIAFSSEQLNQPQDMIAYLVQVQARILLNQHSANNINTAFPGGKELLPQTIDLVACFMGFGVVFANTAYQFKGGCGSCNNQNLNRQAALPELETTYALALFCVLKGVTFSSLKKTLKKHLHKPFRQAYQEISLYLQEPSTSQHNKLKSFLDQ
jgi:hypothetical protein